MKKLTPFFIFVVLVIIFLFDVFVIFKYGAQESISAYIIKASYEFPAMTFFAGFVCGHLFWRMRSNEQTKEIDK